MSEWWEISEEERIKTIYSNFSIQQFWDWWSDETQSWMEIRTDNFLHAKEMGLSLHMPFAASGVFISTYENLLRCIKFSRKKEGWKIWFGPQPRKRNISKYGKMRFGGKDSNIESIKYIFIDIDRKEKTHPATNIELRDCDIISSILLERLKKKGWADNYLKLCSGNGIQLFIKLDIPINMPSMECHNTKTGYVCIPTPQFLKIKKSLVALEKEIHNFIEYKKKKAGIPNVNIDMNSSKLAQVAALPFTKNYKYDGFRWRGILELKTGENTGLSDYLLSLEPKIEQRKYIRKQQAIYVDLKCIPGKLHENKLIQWFLETDFPDGGINNTIWFEIKIMLRDNKIDYHSPEVLSIKGELSHKHGGRSFTMNVPDDKYTFSYNTINNYCIRHFIEPIFQLWPENKKPTAKPLSKFDWKLIEYTNAKYIQKEDIIDILLWMKENVKNNDDMISYWKGLKEQYGEYKAKWWFNHCYERFLLLE